MSESVPSPRDQRGAARPMARLARPAGESPVPRPAVDGPAPTLSQIAWLRRGLDQAGGKLPLFDADGKKMDPRTIRRCVEAGWAEPWFSNPIKPDWLVCKLTAAGRAVALRRTRPRAVARKGATRAKAPPQLLR